MKVFIAQLKCPSNHCVLAVAGEYETQEDAKFLAYTLGQRFAELTQSGNLKHECVLCGATDLQIQIAPTVFASLLEARPHLEAEERRQALAALAMRYIKVSRN